MKRLIPHEEEPALLAALALTALAVPLVTSGLALASTLNIDSGIKSRLTTVLCSLLGAT